MKSDRDVAVIAGLRATVLVLIVGLTATAAAGGELDLSVHEGKVVLVDFWASWCVPCRRSFPWLNEMQARYGDEGLVIVGVNLDARREDAMAFLAEYPADFQVYFDPDARLAEHYGVKAMPSSIVIGRDGAVRARHPGFKVKRQNDYEAILVDALGEPR